MWFLTPEKLEPNDQLIEFIAELGEGQRAKVIAGTAKNWREIRVTYPDDSWSFDIVRFPVDKTGPGAQELDSLRGELAGDEFAGVEPAVNVQWVAQYLTRIKTLYQFRCPIGFSSQPAFELLQEIIDSFRNEGPFGLLYAQFEGWSNENGQNITWEFDDVVTGGQWMALRGENGWSVFQVELGNRAHRRAFCAGKVPAGLETQFYRD
jgi:hypothetical protein